MFEILDNPSQEAVIKVIGVGGCGGNAVDHMIGAGVRGVEFISANTDVQALKRSQAGTQLQLGTGITKGLGAGANPAIGRQAAEEDRDRIADAIRGADMLFLTAGMGGGTGTGAAPVVAQIAKELGVLTVAVVTRPFSFERKRVRIAQEGIDELAKHVDSLIIIPNEKLVEVLGGDVTMEEAFRAANNVLHGAVGGIAEIISCPGLINVDFADVRTVMSETGVAMMGSARAAGVDRAKVAAEQAVACPLLEDINLNNVRGVLVNISAATSRLKIGEVYEVMDTIKEFTADDATVIFGAVFDDSMGDDLRVTMVATGLGQAVNRNQSKPFTVVKTGTDPVPVVSAAADVNFGELDMPTVFRSKNRRSDASAAVKAMTDSGYEPLDIPAFLRRQAD